MFLFFFFFLCLVAIPSLLAGPIDGLKCPDGVVSDPNAPAPGLVQCPATATTCSKLTIELEIAGVPSAVVSYACSTESFCTGMNVVEKCSDLTEQAREQFVREKDHTVKKATGCCKKDGIFE